MLRLLRVFGTVILMVLGLLVLALAMALGWMNTGWGKGYLTERISSAVPGLSVNDLSGFIPFDWTARGVAYEAPSAPYRITSERVGVDTSVLRSLAKRKLVVSDLRLTSPRITIRPAPSASQAAGAPQGLPRLPISVAVEHVVVEDGAVAQESKDMVISPIDITAQASAGPHGASLRISKLVATLDSGPSFDASAVSATSSTARVAAHGQLRMSWPTPRSQPDTPLDAERAAEQWAEATLHAQLGAAVTPFGSREPIEVELAVGGPLAALAFRVEVAEPGGGSARLRGDLEVLGPGTTHAYSMMATLRSFDPSAIDPRLPNAALTLQASAAGHGRPLSNGSALRARVTMARSRVGEVHIGTIVLGLEQQDERWDATGTAEIAGAGLRLAGGGRGRSFEVRARALARGDEIYETFGGLRVQGAASAVIQGRYPSDVRVSVNGNIDELDVAGLGARNIDLAGWLRSGEGPPTAAITMVAGSIGQYSAHGPSTNRARSRGLRNISLRARATARRLFLTATAHPFAVLPDGSSVVFPPLRLRAEQRGRRGVALAPTLPINARLDWRNVPLRAVDHALGRSDSVSGSASVHLVAYGSLAEPTISLTTSIEQPRVSSVALPNALVTASVKLAARQTLGALALRTRSQSILEVKARVAAGMGDRGAPTARRNAALTIDGKIPGYPLGEINQSGDGPRFGGIVDGSLRIDGTVGDPRVAGRLQLHDASIDSRRFGSMTIDVVGGHDGARASAVVHQGSADTLQAQLTYDADRALNLHLLAQSFDLAALQRLASPLRALAPNVDGRLTAKGHWGPPVARTEGPTRRALVFDVDVSDAKIGVVLHPSPENEDDKSRSKTSELGEAQRSFQHALPLELHHLQIHDSRLSVIGPATSSGEGSTRLLTVRKIELSLENLANRPRLLGQDPSVLAVRATVQDHGELVVFATLAPTTPRPTLAGQAALRNLSLASVQNLLRQQTGLAATRGTFDCFVQFIVKNGSITGGIKPELENADVKPANESLWSKIKSTAGDLFLDIFTNEMPEQHKVATVIPIEGRLSNPDVQLVPSVLGIVRNAFVAGLAGGFSRLPPPKAGQPQNVIEQFRRALQPQKIAPEAQPSRTPKQ